LAPIALTDENGMAEITGLPPTTVSVLAVSAPDFIPRDRLAAFARRHDVDLASRDDAELELTVEPVLAASVLVRVGGEAGLPAGTRVDARVLPEGDVWHVPPSVQYDAAAGVVGFPVRLPWGTSGPPRPQGPSLVEVRVISPGFGIEAVVLQRPQGEPRLVGEVDLVPAGELEVGVLGAADWVGKVVLERASVDGVWRRHPRGAAPFSGGPDAVVWRDLARGPFRLSCPALDIVSDAIRPPPEGGPWEFVWDLRGRGWAEGEILLPPGVDEHGLELLVDGEPRRSVWAPARLTGRFFRVMVPGERTVTLTPRHPDCHPDSVDGSIVVREPRAGLVLRMVSRHAAGLDR
jgi:hypothetical protein